MWWSSGAGEAEGRPQSQEGSLRREGERNDQWWSEWSSDYQVGLMISDDQSDQVIIKWEWWLVMIRVIKWLSSEHDD